MDPGDLATLCQACGLCCDGSLFNLVPLAPDELPVARARRLPVVESGRGFEQPCTALVVQGAGADARRACGVYDARPRACRAFACRLYVRHRREGGPLAPRLAAVRRVRALLAELDAAGLDPAQIAVAAPASAEADPARTRAADALDELMQRLEADFARG